MDLKVDLDLPLWQQPIRHADWHPWFQAHSRRTGGLHYLGRRLMGVVPWNATVAEARRTIASRVHQGGVYDARFVYEIADKVANEPGMEEGHGWFPCRVVEQVLLREHCAVRIEVGDTYFDELMADMASFAAEAGLRGAAFVEQKLDPRRVVHCTDEVAAVTLRLRFG